jgi:hypothetical protein
MTWYKKLHWYHLIAIGLILYGVFFGDSVIAQTSSTIMPWLFDNGIRVGYDASSLQGFVATAEYGIKILYLIFRPMLAIAAAWMDNSLVYGDAFFLTNALFKFRQIIRTFANYTIGLYFVWSILAAFFWNKLENVFSGLIKNVAIAAVLVNMSRWMIAALIDLSTVATFSLWALPLYALGDDAVFKENVYYMKTYTNMNINSSTAQNADSFDFSLIYGCSEWDGEIPAEGETETEEGENITRYYLPCAINDWMLYFKDSIVENLSWDNYKQNFVNVRAFDTKVDTDMIDDYYCVYDKQLIRNEFGANIKECTILQQLMVDGKEEGINQCASVDKIVSKAVDNTGPLFTLFSSILNMSELGISTNSWSVKEVGLNLLIKLVFWIALIIPLIAFAVVMIVRVVYLWLIIAFSPLITIAVALKRGDKLEGKIDDMVTKIFKPTQIVSLIFLPVIATFGLSISIIFLSLLKNLPLIENHSWPTATATKNADGCYNDIASSLGLNRDETPEGNSRDIGPTSLNISEPARRIWTDIGNMMSWMVMNLFGVALMRMVVFATLKTNEFTKWIAESIEKTATKFMGTVPLPLMWWMGMSALKQTPDLLQEKFVGSSLKDQQDVLDEFSAWYSGEKSAVNKTLTEWVKNPSILPWINEVNIADKTDFLDDYSSWGKAYAQKAKTYFYDANTKKLTPAGATYATRTGRTQDEIVSWLDAVGTWEQALANKDFNHYMHAQWGTAWFDWFLPNRDKRSVERKNRNNKTAKAIEEGLEKVSGAGNHGEKNINGAVTRWYLVDNASKLTLFRRENGVLVDGTSQTYDIDNTKTNIAELTDKHINAFNQMVALDADNLKALPLYKLLDAQKWAPEITIANGKKYTPQIDTGTNTFTGFIAAATPQ